MAIYMIFYGLALNTSNLKGNIYLNCFISALIDIVAYVVNWYLNKLFSRPTFIACTMTFCGVLLIVIRLVPEGWRPLCSIMKQEDPLSLWNPTCLTWCYHWCLVFFFFHRHAHHVASARLGRKDRCHLCFLPHDCVLHWAHAHCGQEHGPWGHWYSRIFRQHPQSIHSLSWQVFFYFFLACWLLSCFLSCFFNIIETMVPG